MIRHITYCSENMSTSALNCKHSALQNGCDISTIYTEEHLHDDFRNHFKSILSQERGAGYWIWKPQIIMQEFEQCNLGDIVIYTDAGVEFISDVRQLLPSMNEGMLLFGGQYKHAEWCKGDVREATGDEKQLQASAMLFEATTRVVNFVMGWRKMCEIPGYIDDTPSESPNAEGFQEHRHDQAILTELQIMLGIKSHYWPATYNGGKFNYPKNDHTDTYPIIFHHHRKRNNEW
jgi:hypothetical protein